MQSISSKKLKNSPYLVDQLIYLPLYYHDRALISEARNMPKEAVKFVNFLLRERPLQQRLAYKMWHSANAGILKNTFLDGLTEINSPKVTLTRNRVLTPSENWINTLENLKHVHLSFKLATNGNQRLNYFYQFMTDLDRFESINLTEDSSWKNLYYNAIEHLKKETQRKLNSLRQQVAPITENPYQYGDPLIPGRDNDVFLDREDLKEEIARIIRQDKNMPLLLLQGQRRVGKTSLLKFLPELLGPGFRVIFMDLQGTDYCPDILGWLSNIRQISNTVLKHQENEDWQPSTNWLMMWNDVSKHLRQLAQTNGVRLLLCFDEYESLQERGFETDPAQANQLLAAMRSFSQHQTEVIFLFTGAAYFDEITEPDWSKYFVNVKPMEVKYLSFEKTLQLIKHPTPDFPIQYDSGVAEYIYDQTQGHPALTQEICYHIVDLANQHNKNQINLEDLNWVIQEKVVIENNSPMNRFWAGFCYTEALKDTVRKVIKKEPLVDKSSC